MESPVRGTRSASAHTGLVTTGLVRYRLQRAAGEIVVQKRVSEQRRRRRGKQPVIVANSDHESALRNLCQEAADHVEIVSPYFDDASVQTVLDWLAKAKADLTFVFRWPDESEAATAWSPRALQRLQDAGQAVRFVPPETRLHGKVYLGDRSDVVITSANLTALGLGLRARGFNAEVGIRTAEPSLVEDVCGWVDSLGARPLLPEHLRLLKSWASKKEARPPPAPKPLRDREIVEQVLTRARRAGLLTSWSPEPVGLGRNAFSIQLPGLRSTLTVRARVSERWPGPEYHFDVYGKDVTVEELDGFVLVPVGEGRRILATNEAPIVFVPFDRLIGRSANQLSKTKLRALGRGGHKAILTQQDGGWTLRVPATQRGYADVEECINSTAAFAEYYY